MELVPSLEEMYHLNSQKRFTINIDLIEDFVEQEQEANQKRLQDLLLMMRHSDEQENEVSTFIKEIRRYAAIEELDEAVLNRLISKILVGEVKKIDGQKVQELSLIHI